MKKLRDYYKRLFHIEASDSISSKNNAFTETTESTSKDSKLRKDWTLKMALSTGLKEQQDAAESSSKTKSKTKKNKQPETVDEVTLRRSSIGQTNSHDLTSNSKTAESLPPVAPTSEATKNITTSTTACNNEDHPSQESPEVKETPSTGVQKTPALVRRGSRNSKSTYTKDSTKRRVQPLKRQPIKGQRGSKTAGSLLEATPSLASQKSLDISKIQSQSMNTKLLATMKNNNSLEESDYELDYNDDDNENDSELTVDNTLEVQPVNQSAGDSRRPSVGNLLSSLFRRSRQQPEGQIVGHQMANQSNKGSQNRWKKRSVSSATRTSMESPLNAKAKERPMDNHSRHRGKYHKMSRHKYSPAAAQRARRGRIHEKKLPSNYPKYEDEATATTVNTDSALTDDIDRKAQKHSKRSKAYKSPAKINSNKDMGHRLPIRNKSRQRSGRGDSKKQTVQDIFESEGKEGMEKLLTEYLADKQRKERAQKRKGSGSEESLITASDVPDIRSSVTLISDEYSYNIKRKSQISKLRYSSQSTAKATSPGDFDSDPTLQTLSYNDENHSHESPKASKKMLSAKVQNAKRDFHPEHQRAKLRSMSPVIECPASSMDVKDMDGEFESTTTAKAVPPVLDRRALATTTCAVVSCETLSKLATSEPKENEDNSLSETPKDMSSLRRLENLAREHEPPNDPDSPSPEKITVIQKKPLGTKTGNQTRQVPHADISYNATTSKDRTLSTSMQESITSERSKEKAAPMLENDGDNLNKRNAMDRSDLALLREYLHEKHERREQRLLSGQPCRQTIGSVTTRDQYSMQPSEKSTRSESIDIYALKKLISEQRSEKEVVSELKKLIASEESKMSGVGTRTPDARLSSTPPKGTTETTSQQEQAQAKSINPKKLHLLQSTSDTKGLSSSANVSALFQPSNASGAEEMQRLLENTMSMINQTGLDVKEQMAYACQADNEASLQRQGSNSSAQTKEMINDSHTAIAEELDQLKNAIQSLAEFKQQTHDFSEEEQDTFSETVRGLKVLIQKKYEAFLKSMAKQEEEATPDQESSVYETPQVKTKNPFSGIMTKFQNRLQQIGQGGRCQDPRSSDTTPESARHSCLQDVRAFTCLSKTNKVKLSVEEEQDTPENVEVAQNDNSADEEDVQPISTDQVRRATEILGRLVNKLEKRSSKRCRKLTCDRVRSLSLAKGQQPQDLHTDESASPVIELENSIPNALLRQNYSDRRQSDQADAVQQPIRAKSADAPMKQSEQLDANPQDPIEDFDLLKIYDDGTIGLSKTSCRKHGIPYSKAKLLLATLYASQLS